MSSQQAVIDVFCGAGGLSLGLQNAGLNVVMGADIDEDWKFPYTQNINAEFLKKDIGKISGKTLNEYFADADFKILVGCAPCQPFSSHTHKNKEKDDKWKLLDEFSRLISETKPDIVSMENVPQMENFKQGDLFNKFVITW